MTLTDTQKALTAATKAFAKLPSATNWNLLHEAMEAHQNAHFEAKQLAMHNAFYAKSIANPTHNA